MADPLERETVDDRCSADYVIFEPRQCLPWPPQQSDAQAVGAAGVPWTSLTTACGTALEDKDKAAICTTKEMVPPSRRPTTKTNTEALPQPPKLVPRSNGRMHPSKDTI